MGQDIKKKIHSLMYVTKWGTFEKFKLKAVLYEPVLKKVECMYISNTNVSTKFSE